MAAKGDEGEIVVVEANGFAVAAEGELGDGIEAGEDVVEVRGDVGGGGGIESEAVTALALDGAPSAGDQGAGFLVGGGGEGLEDESQAFVGDVGGVVGGCWCAEIVGVGKLVKLEVGSGEEAIGGGGRRVGVRGSGLAHGGETRQNG